MKRILLLIVLILPLNAYSEVIFSKNINNKRVIASLKDEEITISCSGISNSFDISGFTVNDLIVVPDGKNIWVVFLDMAGQSAGGELRTILFNGNFTEITNEKSANHISTKRVQSDNYIYLWQHDSDDLSYVTDIFLVKNGLVESYNKKIWQELIRKYENKANLEKTPWKISRYYSYIAMSYKKIGNAGLTEKYLNKARDIDNNNPYTE